MSEYRAGGNGQPDPHTAGVSRVHGPNPRRDLQFPPAAGASLGRWHGRRGRDRGRAAAHGPRGGWTCCWTVTGCGAPHPAMAQGCCARYRSPVGWRPGRFGGCRLTRSSGRLWPTCWIRYRGVSPGTPTVRAVALGRLVAAAFRAAADHPVPIPQGAGWRWRAAPGPSLAGALDAAVAACVAAGVVVDDDPEGRLRDLVDDVVDARVTAGLAGGDVPIRASEAPSGQRGATLWADHVVARAGANARTALVLSPPDAEALTGRSGRVVPVGVGDPDRRADHPAAVGQRGPGPVRGRARAWTRWADTETRMLLRAWGTRLPGLVEELARVLGRPGGRRRIGVRRPGGAPVAGGRVRRDRPGWAVAPVPGTPPVVLARVGHWCAERGRTGPGGPGARRWRAADRRGLRRPGSVEVRTGVSPRALAADRTDRTPTGWRRWSDGCTGR